MKIDDAEGYLKCHDKEAKKNFVSFPKNLAEAKKELKRVLRKKLYFAVESNKRLLVL